MMRGFRRLLSLLLVVASLVGLVAVSIVPQVQGLSYSGSSSYKSGKYYTNLTKVTLTGDQRTDIVNIAKSQVGYQEGSSSSQLSGTVKGSGNCTEYGRWYGLQDMWCAMFVSWCAYVAGVSTSVVPKHCYTPSGLSWYQSRGLAYSRANVAAGKYTPQPGDIIYFRSSRNQNPTNHVGIVTKYSGGTVYTIEGNTSSATVSTNGGAVCSKSYSISNTYIVYICKPNYVAKETNPLKSVVFDASYYSSLYSDLADTYGTDAAKLYDHFLEFGIKEGRKASAVFDVKYYVNENADLKAEFGKDYQAAYNHFISTGYKEKRKTAKPVDLGEEFYSNINFKTEKNISLSGINIIVYGVSDKPAQIWRFIRQDDGSYVLENQKNGLVMEVAGDGKSPGTNVRLGAYDGSSGQKWYIYQKKTKYILRPQCSSYCVLDVEGASTEDLTNVQISTNDNASGQLFVLSELVVNPDAATLGVSNKQLDVFRKIMYAVETGGQIYCNKDYAAFAEAYANSSEEHAITIGAGQWYGSDAKILLDKIRAAEPTTFSKLDTAGIATDLDNADWNTYQLAADSDKAKCIQAIIASPVGVWCQDQLMNEMAVSYMKAAAELGVTDLDARMMCANIHHQGGLGALKRVLEKTQTPYTLDNIYAALQTDTGNQVGTYTKRQLFVYNNLKKYITDGAADTVKYLPACDSSLVSLVDALVSVGVPNVTPEYRKRLAIANGIEDYAFTAEQNIYLLDLLKAGQAIDPEGVILTGWQTLTGGKRYYYDGAGDRVYGWLTLEDGTYYLDPDTGVMVTGTQVVEGVEYTFDETGALVQCKHTSHTIAGICEECGETVSHSYKGVETLPDCATEGFTTYTCSVCGHSYTDDVVARLEHQYLPEVFAPTCTEGGYTEFNCSGCGDSYIGDEVAVTGHDYAGGHCTVCNAEDPGYYISYYLFGVIDGVDYGFNDDAQNLGIYRFEGSTLIASFTQDSYVGIKTSAQTYYMTKRTVTGTQATLHPAETGAAEKMLVPGGKVISFMLLRNSDGTLDLSYEILGDAAKAPKLELDYPSLSFEEQVQYNIYFHADDLSCVEEMGLITFNSKLTDGTIADAVDVFPGYTGSDGSYMAQTDGISARNLGDTVYLKVYARLTDGKYVYSDVAGYNAVVYAKTVLRNSSNAYMKSLVVAMLNYGAEAQLYFGYNTENLMSNILTEEQRALVRSYDESMVNPLTAVDSAKAGSLQYNGSAFVKRVPTVSFDGAFSINYYFTTAVKPDSAVKLYYWTREDYNAAATLSPKNATGSVTMTLTEEENRYWGKVSGIAAKELDETVFVVGVYACDGVTYSTGVLAYSIGRYCEGIAAKDTSEQQMFAQATAIYGYYAKEYFSNL